MKSKKGPSGKGAKSSPFTQAKLRKVAGARVLNNAESLVDSPHLLKRLKDGSEISGTFYGHGAAITCSVSARRFSLQDLCTCSATYFCRHAAALVLTFLERPETFLDLDEHLDNFSRLPREDLEEMLRHLIGRYPGSSLEALGQEGFDPSEVLDEHDDELLLGEPLNLFGEEDDFLDGYGAEEELEEGESVKNFGDFDDFDDFDDPGSRGNLN